MSLLSTIRDKLLTVNKNVFYGSADQLNEWDYIVFMRQRTNITDRIKKALYFSVAVVAEDYIEEDMEEKVIKAMTSIPGMKVADSDISYEYTIKPNTNTVVELMVITFVKGAARNA